MLPDTSTGLPGGSGISGAAVWLLSGHGQCASVVVLFQLTRSPCWTSNLPGGAPTTSPTNWACTSGVGFFKGTILIDQSGIPASHRAVGMIAKMASVMLHRNRARLDHLDGEHHAAVLVRQDVAVQDVEAGIVDEPAAHLEVARDHVVRVRLGRRE